MTSFKDAMSESPEHSATSVEGSPKSSMRDSEETIRTISPKGYEDKICLTHSQLRRKELDLERQRKAMGETASDVAAGHMFVSMASNSAVVCDYWALPVGESYEKNHLVEPGTFGCIWMQPWAAQLGMEKNESGKMCWPKGEIGGLKVHSENATVGRLEQCSKLDAVFAGGEPLLVVNTVEKFRVPGTVMRACVTLAND